MIRTKRELDSSRRRVNDMQKIIDDMTKEMEGQGHSPEHISSIIAPMESFKLQIEEEVSDFLRVMSGKLLERYSLDSVGRLLIEARLVRGWTQRELAWRLGVGEMLISRWERNEYYGLTTNRLRRIAEVLELRIELIPTLGDLEETRRQDSPDA